MRIAFYLYMLCCSLKSSGLRNKILIFFPRTYRQIRLHYVYSFCIVLLLKMLRLHLVFSYYYILVLCAYCKGSTDSPVTFAFKEYQYKDSPKNVSTKYIFIFVVIMVHTIFTGAIVFSTKLILASVL